MSLRIYGICGFCQLSIAHGCACSGTRIFNATPISTTVHYSNNPVILQSHNPVIIQQSRPNVIQQSRHQFSYSPALVQQTIHRPSSTTTTTTTSTTTTTTTSTRNQHLPLSTHTHTQINTFNVGAGYGNGYGNSHVVFHNNLW